MVFRCKRRDTGVGGNFTIANRVQCGSPLWVMKSFPVPEAHGRGRSLAATWCLLLAGVAQLLGAEVSVGPSGIPLVPGSYAVWDLGSLGGNFGQAFDLNDDGTVVGVSRTAANETVAFRWTLGDGMVALPGLTGGSDHTARAINAAGLIAGDAGRLETVDGRQKYVRYAVTWSPDGALTTLPVPADGEVIEVGGVSDDGAVVGTVGITLPPEGPVGPPLVVRRAVRWAGGVEFLTAGAKAAGRALDISPDGRFITGPFQGGFPLNQIQHAVLFGSDPPVDLHTLGTPLNSVSLAVNNLGQVVGYAHDVDSAPFYRPVFASAETGLRLLSHPTGAPYGQATDLTDNGLAVGILRNDGAVLWVNVGQPEEKWVSLQSLLPRNSSYRLNGPLAVNRRGEIAATAGYEGTRPVLLYPTNLWRQVHGRIVTQATEHETNVTTRTQRTFIYPLAEAPVELFAVQAGALVSVRRGVTDRDGRYAFLLPPTADTEHTLVVTLRDDSGWVDVRDGSSDPANSAWLRTPAFTVPLGDSAADVTLVINGNLGDGDPNETTYQINGRTFSPGDAATAAVTDAASNSTAAHFAHLTVFYRNLRLAARFAVERLGLAMPRVEATAFEPRGTFGPARVWSTGDTNVSLIGQTWRAPSFFRLSDASLHFAEITSSFNQPTLGLTGNPNGYAALRTFTNHVTGATTNAHRVWGREWPDNREFHEYAHLVMWSSPIGGANALPARAAGDENHGGLNNSNSSDSWTEGFAEFLSLVISDQMLDREEKERPALYVYQGSVANLEDVLSYVRVIERPGEEEFLVASMLWDVHDSPNDEGLQLSVADWWTVLSADGAARVNFKNVFDALLAYGTAFPAKFSPAEWRGRAEDALLFDDLHYGLADPRSYNGTRDDDEPLGPTSWNTSFLHRPSTEPGTWLTLGVAEPDGTPLADVTYEIEVLREAPMEPDSFAWQIPTRGPSPVAVPFFLPQGPSRIRITPWAPGNPVVAPVVLNGAELWTNVGEVPGEGEIGRHQFVVVPGPRLDVELLNQGTQLRLSWSATDPAYVLQFSPRLGPGASWARAPFTPVRQGDRWVLTVPVPPQTTFLRLSQP